MIKLYQKDWHGIDFCTFTECDPNKIAGIEFYDKFYKSFFQKFKSFEDLNKDWVSYKKQIAIVLSKEIAYRKNILSIGCGIGIVEKFLIENMSSINITAIEPSTNVSRWIKNIDRINLKDGYFPEILNPNDRFEVAFANGIDYVFDKNEYEIFLKSIINFGIKEILVVSASYYLPSFKVYSKDLIKNILTKVKLYRGNQFWGYNRSIKEQLEAIKKAGFKNVSLIYKTNSTIIIKGTK